MKRFLKNPRNRLDIYHVAAPLFLAMAMGSTSFSGALLFLFVWGMARWIGHG